jgi:hydroxymethylbilane synthase
VSKRVPVRIATRGSELARAQAQSVGEWLGLPFELVIVVTTGDRRLDADLHAIGGQGVFVKEVQQALLDDRADIAVHSAKDLPTETVPGISIAGVMPRGDVRDALVGSKLTELPEGATVGTSSVRRRAQLANLRPDLNFVPIRGNIRTRLDKLSGLDAIFVASVALDRLGIEPEVYERIDPAVVCPQVGQAVIAVETRTEDDLLEHLRSISDEDADFCLRAERAFLARFGTGCSLPVGAHCYRLDDSFEMIAAIASEGGKVVMKGSSRGKEAVELGETLASDLIDRGALALME